MSDPRTRERVRLMAAQVSEARKLAARDVRQGRFERDDVEVFAIIASVVLGRPMVDPDRTAQSYRRVFAVMANGR